MAKIFGLKINTDKVDKLFGEIKKIGWNDVRRIGADKAKEQLKEDIVNTIKRGNSPVKGERRFVDYSDSYKAAIRGEVRFFTDKQGKVRPILGGAVGLGYGKKLRPINLTLSGKMLNSVKGRVTDRGISLWFTSPIAKYHNIEGAGKSKTIRRMLPKSNEDLKESVKERAARTIGNAYEKVLNSKKRSV